MRFCLYDCDTDEREKLESEGLFVYDLRLDDNCCDIATIEPYVWVNNGGNIVTSDKIIFLHDEDNFVDFETFCENNEQVDELWELNYYLNPPHTLFE